MAVVVSGKIDLSIQIAELVTGSVRAGGPSVHTFDLSTYQTVRMANGTSAGQIDEVYSSKDTAIGAGATADIDFAGSLVDITGAALSFAKLKLLHFYNGGTVSIKIKAKTAIALPWFDGTTDSVVLKAGDSLTFFSPTGITVGAGATDQITITNTSGGAAAAYTMIAAGTSA